MFDHRDQAIGRAQIPCICCEGPKMNVFMDAKYGRDHFIQGPCCTCDLWPKFNISRNAHVNGEIQKVWGGLHRECCTNADIFQVRFPPDATPQEKAALLGATFLIDYNYFEQSKNQQRVG
jgi:hypothetical protein